MLSVEYHAGLVFCQPRPFDAVGVVCRLDLRFMVDAAIQSVFLLVEIHRQKVTGFHLHSPCSRKSMPLTQTLFR